MKTLRCSEIASTRWVWSGLSRGIVPFSCSCGPVGLTLPDFVIGRWYDEPASCYNTFRLSRMLWEDRLASG